LGFITHYTYCYSHYSHHLECTIIVLSAYQLLIPLHSRFVLYQDLLVGGSIIYPIVASATTRPPQGHLISDSGGCRTPESLHRCQRRLDNPRGVTCIKIRTDLFTYCRTLRLQLDGTQYDWHAASTSNRF